VLIQKTNFLKLQSFLKHDDFASKFAKTLSLLNNSISYKIFKLKWFFFFELKIKNYLVFIGVLNFLWWRLEWTYVLFHYYLLYHDFFIISKHDFYDVFYLLYSPIKPIFYAILNHFLVAYSMCNHIGLSWIHVLMVNYKL
jgi:hypothetical protein